MAKEQNTVKGVILKNKKKVLGGKTGEKEEEGLRVSTTCRSQPIKRVRSKLRTELLGTMRQKKSK